MKGNQNDYKTEIALFAFDRLGSNNLIFVNKNSFSNNESVTLYLENYTNTQMLTGHRKVSYNYDTKW